MWWRFVGVVLTWVGCVLWVCRRLSTHPTHHKTESFEKHHAARTHNLQPRTRPTTCKPKVCTAYSLAYALRYHVTHTHTHTATTQPTSRLPAHRYTPINTIHTKPHPATRDAHTLLPRPSSLFVHTHKTHPTHDNTTPTKRHHIPCYNFIFSIFTVLCTTRRNHLYNLELLMMGI